MTTFFYCRCSTDVSRSARPLLDRAGSSLGKPVSLLAVFSGVAMSICFPLDRGPREVLRVMLFW